MDEYKQLVSRIQLLIGDDPEVIGLVEQLAERIIGRPRSEELEQSALGDREFWAATALVTTKALADCAAQQYHI